jgi:hypothetical protein
LPSAEKVKAFNVLRISLNELFSRMKHLNPPLKTRLKDKMKMRHHRNPESSKTRISPFLSP